MRIATMIIALVLMFGVGLQSCAIAVGGSLGKNKNLSSGGSIGLLVALLFLIGGAFAYGQPKVSLGVFLAAALLSFLGSQSGFSDLVVWGIISLVLAALSYGGVREKARTVKP